MHDWHDVWSETERWHTHTYTHTHTDGSVAVNDVASRLRSKQLLTHAHMMEGGGALARVE